ncbi:uncharacterized protein J4E84_006209 [Alternaria hordeiaustralica]|uniref:uncharacterized protein n=1 Tax=Alternaria hordeiaustralica TaxID=1187925 RepID=UPI0020C250B4|nr:uncharacterized protein J4E84_006209 [Alternaria hordeiaustralica]KAI4685481.1 hypothetical protein J4E84_006209 [Alternaria hordeiaustralica]
MNTASDIDKSFTKALNEAGELYNNDRLDECIKKTRALLADDAIPRYHRMKALLLLASTLGNWLDASNCHAEAETLWRVVRRWNPEGEDAVLDRHMNDMREHLDEVGAALERTEPEDYYLEDDVDDEDDDSTAHEEQVADATAAMETLEMTDNQMKD